MSMQRREDLERMREVLLLALDGDRLLQGRGKTTFSEPAASVVRELRAVVRELEELSAGAEEGSAVDEIAARRAARRSGADDSAQSSRRGQPRRRGGGDRTS